MKAQGEIELRDVWKSDIPLIYTWENNPDNWEVSEIEKAYSLQEIIALMESASDFQENKQKRWLIIKSISKKSIGAVDIFQAAFPEGEVGVGILIADKKNRRKGFAESAIELLVKTGSNELNIHTFHADVHLKNKGSLALFEKCGFVRGELVTDNSNFDSLITPVIRMTLCVKK